MTVRSKPDQLVEPRVDANRHKLREAQSSQVHAMNIVVRDRSPR